MRASLLRTDMGRSQDAGGMPRLSIRDCRESQRSGIEWNRNDTRTDALFLGRPFCRSRCDSQVCLSREEMHSLTFLDYNDLHKCQNDLTTERERYKTRGRCLDRNR